MDDAVEFDVLDMSDVVRSNVRLIFRLESTCEFIMTGSSKSFAFPYDGNV